MRTLSRFGAGVLALSVALGVAACGDDSDDDAADTEDTTTTTEEAPAAGEPITVTAVDYAFEGLPESIEAGTQLKLVNESAGEAHELVAVLIPATETRPVSELIQLSDEELGAAFGGEPAPATVLLAPPSSTEQIAALGDGTIAEPGRYAVICSFPVGGDPGEILDPNAEGPPSVPEGTETHDQRGMFAELTVT
ncbi:MAG: hypothetical protein M3Z03_15445 [Actinomycetota bacterium]|nr:hypothetical protein [Actinomycetota bacterium]